MATEGKKFDLGKVMVIGGCGFLGHHVVNLLLRDYAAKVTVVDLRCTRNRRPDADGVAYVEADIADAERLTAVFKEARPDVVVHTASPAAQGDSKIAKALFKKVNVDGTRAVVDACRAVGVKALVYTSSASVISDNVSDLINADERWPVLRGADQSEYYSETKAAAEEMVLAANEPGKLVTCAIRPSGIVGEGDVMTLHHMINAYREGKWRVQAGGNDNLFDFTYVVNVAHAHLLAARALLLTCRSKTAPLDNERVDGEAFLITNDQPVYFFDFARMIWHAAGCPHGVDKVWVLPKDVGILLGWLSETACWLLGRTPTFNRMRIIYSCMTRYYNISKAKRRLGYAPIVDLEEGVRRAVKWSIEQEQAGVVAKER